MSDKTVGYQNPNVDRSFGTSMNEANGLVRTSTGFSGTASGGQITRTGGIVRASVPAQTGLVSVGGIETSPEVARMLGVEPSVPVPSVPVPVQAPQAPAQTEAQAVIARGDAQLERVAQDLDASQLNALGSDIAEFSEEAEDFAERVAPDFVEGKYQLAESWMQEAGLPTFTSMSHTLSHEDQVEARAAVIRGDHNAFMRYANRAISNAQEIASAPGFAQEVREAGGEVANGYLYLDGQPVGSVIDCLLDGTLSYGDDDYE